MESITDRTRAISEALDRGETARENVRTILSWVHAERRGYWVVASIRTALKTANLVTVPDFESAYIDSAVEFRRPPGNSPPSAEQAAAPASTYATPQTPEPEPVVEASFQLSKLAAANNPPISVTPDTTLETVVTLMLTQDFSQLPIMQGDRDVRGAISWRSIASRLATGQEGKLAKEFSDPVEVVDATVSIFEAVASVVRNQYVLVRATDRKIVGIVTSSDLSEQFQFLTEPFLLLSEIENDLRRIIQSKFESSDLIAVKDPSDVQRVINSVHDLTFGEYIRLMENPDLWSKLQLPLERKVVIASLKKVKEIRNDVMHFDPDGIPAEDLKTLRDFAAFLARLRTLKVTL